LNTTYIKRLNITLVALRVISIKYSQIANVFFKKYFIGLLLFLKLLTLLLALNKYYNFITVLHVFKTQVRDKSLS